MAAYINPDLLYQILIKSPPKSVLRFRSVSRSWKSVIDSKPFILDHLSDQTPQILALNDHQLLVIDPQTLPNLKTLNTSTISLHYYPEFCSVHGVICLNFGSELRLWNPAIRRSSEIETPYRYGFHSHLCGFWINSSKFVALEMPSELEHDERMKTNVWKWRDSLSLLHWNSNECNLWAMESGSWCKMYSLSVPSVASGVVKDVVFVEEASERVIVQISNGDVMLYDPKLQQKCKCLVQDRVVYGLAYDFVESYISPPSSYVWLG